MTYGGTGDEYANGLLVNYMDSSVFIIGTSTSITQLGYEIFYANIDKNGTVISYKQQGCQSIE